ncbi:PAS domain-containing sensor histidine kinase [Alsobacter sp. SYSU BS001988]
MDQSAETGAAPPEAGQEHSQPGLSGAGDTSALREPDSALLRTILDSIPGRVAFVDWNERYVYVNREFLAFHGKRPDEVVGRFVWEVLGRAAYDQIKPYTPRIRAGEVVRWEGWITYAGNRRRYIQQTYTPYSPGGGEPQGNIAFGRDLTDLKAREQELAERTALNSAIVASTLDCLVAVDEAGLTVEFNPAAEAAFGYSRAEALGRPVMDAIMGGAGRPSFLSAVEARDGGALGRRAEIQAVCKDGRVLPMEFAVTEASLSGRRLFIIHLRDLTEARAAEAEIERQRKQLSQIEKVSAMGALLAGVAHELNNPLAILLAQSTLLVERAQTEDVRARAQRIQAAAERSGRIVRSFLSMAREASPRRGPVRLNDLVTATLDLLSYGLRAAHVEVSLDLDPDLPVISADGDLIGQVLSNLLVNAQQVLQEQAGPRRVTVRTRRDDAGVVLEVEDNGPGVPNDIAEKIFDPYYTTKAPGVGTGIGLAICRNVLGAHGASIALDQAGRRDGGALFRVAFPPSVAAPSGG